MLTIEQCKNYLGDSDLSDKEIEQLRNSLYLIVGSVLDNSHGAHDNAQEKQDNK